MREGERIHVQTRDFEGTATILYIAPGEFYPVQVEMDTPDSDGHKIQRITYLEITKEPKEKPAPAGITFHGPEDPQQYIGEVVKEVDGYSFKIGQQFILGVVSSSGVYKGGPATSFYLYNPENMNFRGCMPASMFEIVGSYEAGQSVIKSLETAQKEPEVLGIPAEVSDIAGKVNYEQMTLLDFL